MNSLRLLGQKIGLDYVGMDFSLMPDGRILLFEANSGMRVNNDYNKSFPYLEKYTLALRKRFEKMVSNKIQQDSSFITCRKAFKHRQKWPYGDAWVVSSETGDL